MFGFSLWGIRKWPKFWRGEYKKVGEQLGILSPRWARMGQAIYPFVWFLGLTLGPALVSGYIEQVTNGAIETFAAVLVNVFVGLMFLTASLCALIVLFNRPRFLIPPHGRNFNGLFGDWVVTVWRRITKKQSSDESTFSDTTRHDAASPTREDQPGRHRRPYGQHRSDDDQSG